jgi:hypothetical protein
MGGGGSVAQACGAVTEESRGGPAPDSSSGVVGTAACGRRACGMGGVGWSKHGRGWADRWATRMRGA